MKEHLCHNDKLYAIKCRIIGKFKIFKYRHSGTWNTTITYVSAKQLKLRSSKVNHEYIKCSGVEIPKHITMTLIHFKGRIILTKHHSLTMDKP